MKKAYTSVKSTVSKAYNTAKSYVSKAYTSVKNTVSKGYNTVKTYVRNTYNSAKTYVSNTYQKVVSTTKTAVSNTQQKVKTAYEKAKEMGTSTYNWVSSKSKEAQNIAKNWTKSLEENMKHVCESVKYAEDESTEEKLLEKKSVLSGDLEISENAIIEAQGSYDVLYVDPEATASFDIFEKDKDSMNFYGMDLGIGISAGGGKTSGEVEIGSSILGAGAKAEGDVLSGKLGTGVSAGINENDKLEVGVKAEAFASAASGGISGTINILGVELGIGVDGHAGAIGGSAKVGIFDNKLKVDIDAAALLGTGVEISVGLAD